jgi:hypothetical protein
MTHAELARRLGVSRSAVSHAASKGMPVYSVELAKAWRREHLDPAYSARWDKRRWLSAGPAAPAVVVAGGSVDGEAQQPQFTLRDLAVLAGRDFERWEAPLRERLRKLPLGADVELDFALFDLLAGPALEILAPAEPRPEDSDPPGEADPLMGQLIHLCAAGEIVAAHTGEKLLIRSRRAASWLEANFRDELRAAARAQPA